MPENVSDWLDALGLSQYATLFDENAIDWDVLPELDQETLKDVGIARAGDRLRLIKAARALRSKDTPAGLQDVPQEPVREPPADQSLQAERRQLTVMFCDLVGSTDLSGKLDPEHLREVVRAYQTTAAEVIQRYGGHIAQYLGDGLLVYFGYPAAHEDDAQRAVYAGTGIPDAIDTLNTSLRSRFDVQLAVRIGIHTGPVVVGDIGTGGNYEQLAMGETPNLAARLQELATPGVVVISDSTRRLLGESFVLRPLREQQLKGIADPVVAFAVLGQQIAESRFAASLTGGAGLAAMAGRKQDLALLLDRWQQAKAGEGQMVVLTGEAGIGKSRIVRGLVDELQDDEIFRITYQCSPHHMDTALYPAIQQMKRVAGFDAKDTPEAQLDKLQLLLRRQHDDQSIAVRLIAILLGLGQEAETRYQRLDYSPQQIRTRTLEVMIDEIVGLSSQRPLLLVLEDAHWIDPSTLELAELILERILNQRIMMLITARPTFKSDFGGHPLVTRLALNRLGRAAINSIVERITLGKALPDRIIDEIAAKTDGIPLFVEEFTKTFLESKQLRETEHSYEFDGLVNQLSIPSSLHDSLMARLDRMQPLKRVTQTAACIGREFSYSLLAAVSGMRAAELNAGLEQLVAAELVFVHGAPPHSTYTFKHALLRDVAYESLLVSERPRIHGTIADALDQMDPPASPALIAMHAEQAHQNERAVSGYFSAGDAAARVFAHQEAVGHLTHALSLITQLDSGEDSSQLELQIRIALGVPLIAVRGYASPEVEANFRRALAICDGLKVDTTRQFAVLRGLWNCLYDKAEINESMEIAHRLVDFADNESDPTASAFAYRALGSTLKSCGRLDEASQAFQHVLDNPDRWSTSETRITHGEAPEVIALAYQAWIACTQGRPVTGLRLAQESIDRANSIGVPILIVFSKCIALQIFALRREMDSCAALAATTLQQSDEYGFVFWSAHCKLHGGWAAALLHPSAQAQADAKAGLDAWRDTGARLHIPTWSCLVADATMAVADFSQADSLLENGLALANQTGDIWMVPELLRLLAKSKWHQGQPEQAVDLLQQAIVTAQNYSAHWFVLRSARDLANMQVGKPGYDDAIKLLRSALLLCPEGSECIDVLEAQEVMALTQG